MGQPCEGEKGEGRPKKLVGPVQSRLRGRSPRVRSVRIAAASSPEAPDATPEHRPGAGATPRRCPFCWVVHFFSRDSSGDVKTGTRGGLDSQIRSGYVCGVIQYVCPGNSCARLIAHSDRKQKHVLFSQASLSLPLTPQKLCIHRRRRGGRSAFSARNPRQRPAGWVAAGAALLPHLLFLSRRRPF